MSNILKIIGSALLLNGVPLCIAANLNFGTILTVFLGALLLVWGIFYTKVKTLTSHGFLKIIRYIVILLICAEAALVGFLAIYGQVDHVNYDEDVVIVLGAGIRGDQVTLPLRLRLDSAIEYHEKNPNALIVVTGGQGFQETVTEAYAMEQYLLRHGVPQSVIIKEEQATSTNENMRFSKAILDPYFDAEYKIVVITNNFHIFRGVSIAKREGFSTVLHKSAGLPWYNLVPCYLRESLAVLKMWILD